ncbi:MAG: tetratricopeptide repeat protein [Desulfobacter sp.]|nr:MAG: tetratricopeptide repeat protein [Desulfobacter sp.]
MKKIVVLCFVLLCLGTIVSAGTEDELFDRGVALLKKEKAGEAVAVFSQLIKIMPDSPDAYRNRGVGYMKMKRYDEAINDFQTAVTLKPDLKDLYSNMGVAWYYKKEYRKAIEFYDKELALRPDNHFGYFNRAICWAALNEYDRGIADAEKSLDLFPAHYLALCLKGDLLVKTGKTGAAAEVYEKAVALDPGREYARRRLNEMTAERSDGQGEPEEEATPKKAADTKEPVLAQAPAPVKKTEKEEKTVETKQPVKSEMTAQTEKTARFELQVGAYLGKDNAGKMLEKLSQKGYPARILELTGNKGRQWYLVRSGAYGSRAEAGPDRDKLKADTGGDAVIRPWGRF